MDGRIRSFSSHRSRLGIALALMGLAAMLTGCDEPLSGKYEEIDGAGALEFRGHQVYVTLAVVGTTFAAEYERQGDQIIISGGGPAQVYALNADGSIAAAAGLTFVKSVQIE